MKKVYYAGIDYHKNYSTVCILDADRSVVVEATVRPNTKENFATVFSRVDGPIKTTFECGLGTIVWKKGQTKHFVRQGKLGASCGVKVSVEQGLDIHSYRVLAL